ncbi:hypothetical protein BRC93_15550 [Halobacteriales archaeon QS_5_70_15]|nr:MAG: hypothetical protein BRC93_15550 [Halobacteriales archaeon QS_5_70_15]
MPTYVTLVNFTEDGLEDVAELPDHVERIEEMKRALGGEPKGFFLTFGQYDMVAFSEMPDAEATAKVQLASAMGGTPKRKRSGRSPWTNSARSSKRCPNPSPDRFRPRPVRLPFSDPSWHHR